MPRIAPVAPLSPAPAVAAPTAVENAAGSAAFSAAKTRALRAAALLEHPALATAVTVHGRVDERNALWNQLFALPDDVSIESHVVSLFANATAADRFERSLRVQLVAGGDSPSALVEHALVRRDGSGFTGEIFVWFFDAAQIDHPLSADAIWQVRDISAELTLKRDLRDLEAYHRDLARHRWDMTFVVDRKGRISYASPSVEESLGHAPHTLLGAPFTTLLDPQHASAVSQWLRQIATRRRSDTSIAEPYRLRVLDSSGRPRTLLCRSRNCFDLPHIAGMVIHARDVAPDEVADREAASKPADALRSALLALAAAASGEADVDMARVLDTTRTTLAAGIVAFVPEGDASAVVSPVGRAAPPALRPSGIGRCRVVRDLTIDAAIEPDERATFASAGLRALVEVRVAGAAVRGGRLVVGAGEPREWTDAEVDFVAGAALLIASAASAPPPVVASAPGATPGASTDAATGLPDRAAARAWLEEKVAAHGTSGSLTLLSIDLDRLKDINDRHGHARGDAVIARSAETIRDVVGDGSFVARVGNDEFLVALVDATTRAVEETNAMLLKRIGSIDPTLPRVEASIGTARLPTDARDAAKLWQRADLAMREAKQRGGGQAFVFDPRLEAAVQLRKVLDVEISEALQRDEFVLFYQPQIALATGTVIGLEALLRWHHPTRGLLLPDAFIDAAVEAGLIEALTKSVVAKVCEQLAAWRRDAALPELPVAVNVASTQFHDRRLPSLVASALLRSGLPARFLVLELGERTLVGDAAETERVVRELSRLGVRTAVGGFALGHGALKQLRQLRVAQVKVDRGFVGALPDDEASVSVVRTMIDVCKRLKCQVFAEGVETRAQFETLRDLGCEGGQGFYFGAPLAVADTREFVLANLRAPVR